MNATEDPGERDVLTFKVGESEYGIALAWVWAVQEAGRSAGGNEAEIEFRGERLPLIDLAGWLGSGEGGRGSSLLVVGRSRARVAMRVGSPVTVVQAREAQAWPDCCRSFVEGVFEGILPQGDRLLLLVDPEGVCRAASGQGEATSQGGEGE